MSDPVFPSFLSSLSTSDNLFDESRWANGTGSLDVAFSWLQHALELAATSGVSPFVILARDVAANKGCKSYTVAHRLNPAILNPPVGFAHLYAVTATDTSITWPFFDLDFPQPVDPAALISQVQKLSAAFFRQLFYLSKSSSVVQNLESRQIVDIYVSDGNSEKLPFTSFHVHLGPCCVPLHIIRSIVGALISDPSVDTSGVDSAVYGERRCLRLPYSAKKVTPMTSQRVLLPFLRLDTEMPSASALVFPEVVTWNLQEDWSNVVKNASDRSLICPFVTLLVSLAPSGSAARAPKFREKRLRDVIRATETVSTDAQSLSNHIVMQTMQNVFQCVRNMLWHCPETSRYIRQTFPNGVRDLDIRVRLQPNGASVDVLNCRFCVISQREHRHIHMKFAANRRGFFFHCWHPNCQATNAEVNPDVLLDTRRWPLIPHATPEIIGHLPAARPPIAFHAPRNTREGCHVPYLKQRGLLTFRPRFVNIPSTTPASLTYSGPIGKFLHASHPPSVYNDMLDEDPFSKPSYRVHDETK